MIKNILYSICFHLTILIAIYFGLQKINYSVLEDPSREISISVMDNKESNPAEDETKSEPPKQHPTPKKETPKTPAPTPPPPPPPQKEIEKKKVEAIPDPAPPIKKEETPPPPPAKVEEVKVIPKIKEISIKEIYQDSQTEDIDELNLSAVHRRSMKNHLNYCFSGILNGQSEDLQKVENIEIIFHLTENGVIKFDYKENTKIELLKDEKLANYRRIIEKIDNAAKKCAVFRNLPQDKHNVWKEFKVLFKP